MDDGSTVKMVPLEEAVRIMREAMIDVRREALGGAAKFLEDRATEAWRGVREAHTIMCCAEWVRDLTRDAEGNLPPIEPSSPPER